MPRISVPTALMARLHALAERRRLRRRGLVPTLLAGMLDALEHPVPSPRWELCLRRPEPTEPNGPAGLGRILGDHPRWTTEPADLADGESGPVPCRLAREDGHRIVARYLPSSRAIRLTIGEPDPPADARRDPEAIGVVLLEPGDAWLDLSDDAWRKVIKEADRIADRGAGTPSATQADEPS